MPSLTHMVEERRRLKHVTPIVGTQVLYYSDNTAAVKCMLNGVEGFCVTVDHHIRMPEATALVMTVLRLEHSYLFDKELKAP